MPTDRAEYHFSPAVYEHAARILGRTPWDVSRSGALLVAAHRAAYELYRHIPVVVGIDIYNLEAEAYGAVVSRPEGEGIPAIHTPVCNTVSEVVNLIDFDPVRSGRLGLIIGAAQALKRQLPDAVVKVPVSGPFSLCATLCGLETLLCEALTEPEAVQGALAKLVANQIRFCEAIAGAGVGLTVFESAATPPLVPVNMFRDLVLPPLEELMRRAAGLVGVPAPCVIGGNTLPILDQILSTGTNHVICPSETDQAGFMVGMAAHPAVLVRINMRPAVFCLADPEEAFREADRVMALAGRRHKILLGSGVLPYEAIPETVLAVKRHIECGRGRNAT